ncbi:uncharacterized protein [Eurosta solidaginis]|uniref:uncharacterized protein isoform X4 n=1 Tax=Eurosta solidaginis TaxID=178769 RepID=UPI0035312B7A
MAPEQGPISGEESVKATTSTSPPGDGPPNTQPQSEDYINLLNTDSLNWIYSLKKERLIEECKRYRIFVNGSTVTELRIALSAYVKAKRNRKSTENLLREVEDEIKAEENSQIKTPLDQSPSIHVTTPSSVTKANQRPSPPRTELTDAEVMNTVRRWDVHFTGGETLYDFLERIEELAECYSIPLDRLLPTLPETLRGKALQWFRIRKAEILSWAQFRTAAEQFFLPRRHLHQLEDAIRQRRQQGREKAKDYILAMQTMIRQHPIMSRENHLERIYDGLRVEYRLFAKRSEFRTIEELMELTEEFELLQLEATRQSRQTAHSLSSLSEEYSREESCWRCKELGHMRHQCRKARRLFCSRCGRDNVLSRDCWCDKASTLTPVRLRHRKTPQSAAIDEQPPNEMMDGRHYVKVTIEGLNVRALLDTGATLTYVGDTIRKHLEGKKIACAPSVRNVQLTDRTCVVSSYTYPVTILCNNKPTHMRVFTLPNLAEYMILGMDFRRERRLTLTLDGNILPPATPTQNTIFAKLSTVTERKHLRSTQNAELAVFLNHHQRIFGGITGPSRAAEHVISLKYDRPLKRR